MSFFSGRVSFARYPLSGRSPRQFGPEHLEQMARHAIGRQRTASADGSQAGWTAGAHILDTRFELAKNVVEDTLQFALRVDTVRIPADLLRAYTEQEYEQLAADEGEGRARTRLRREARAAALERLQSEARDGRFTHRRAYPVLWDRLSNELLIAAPPSIVGERLAGLFHQTFGQRFEAAGAGRRAFLLAEPRRQTRGADDARPTVFGPGGAPATVSWAPDEDSRDFLGNEFLLWLWFRLETDSDTVALADGSEAVVMFTRTLVMECPHGDTGRQTVRSEAPAALPESHRALQAGKLPRRAGLTVARHGRQYEFTLQGESLTVSGAKLPPPEDGAGPEERVELLRHLIETLDLLYDAFGRRRLGSEWGKEVESIRAWLGRDKRTRFSPSRAAAR